jgi:leucine dehydrogenase
MPRAKSKGEWVFDMARRKGHEQLSFFFDKETNLRVVVAIHSTTLGPAVGGTRMWPYPGEKECVDEALHISELMTCQSAISGADFGGGTALLWGDPGQQKTEAYLRSYGRFLEGLHGRFLTYADLGTNDKDMLYVRRETRAALSAPREGAEVLNTADVTAYGVICGMKACAKQVFGVSSLEGLKVAVQGTGEVGHEVCSYLAKEKAEVLVSDLDYDAIKRVQDEHPDVTVVRPEEILEAECDVLCPCAVAGVLSETTIAKLKCKIVAGAAIGVLATESDGELLHKRSILYAPDFAVCAGSSIVFSQLYADLPVRQRFQAVGSVYDIMAHVIARSQRDGVSTLDAARSISLERIREVGKVRRILS